MGPQKEQAFLFLWDQGSGAKGPHQVISPGPGLGPALVSLVGKRLSGGDCICSHSNVFHCLASLDLKTVLLVAGPHSSAAFAAGLLTGQNCLEATRTFGNERAVGSLSTSKSCHFHS